MVHLRYPYAGYFTDHERDERYEGPCEADIPEENVEHYLTRRWERVEDEEDDVEDVAESEEFDRDDEVTDRDELEDMSYDELRSMASKSDREDVDGRMRMDDIIDAFAEN